MAADVHRNGEIDVVGFASSLIVIVDHLYVFGTPPAQERQIRYCSFTLASVFFVTTAASVTESFHICNSNGPIQYACTMDSEGDGVIPF